MAAISIRALRMLKRFLRQRFCETLNKPQGAPFITFIIVNVMIIIFSQPIFFIFEIIHLFALCFNFQVDVS